MEMTSQQGVTNAANLGISDAAAPPDLDRIVRPPALTYGVDDGPPPARLNRRPAVPWQRRHRSISTTRNGPRSPASPNSSVTRSRDRKQVVTKDGQVTVRLAYGI
jgi:hypothetical protein